MMKRFWGVKNVRAISSLYVATMDGRVKETVYGVIGALNVTPGGVVAPRETVTKNGGL